MRKVRREIVKTINDFRAGAGKSKIQLDPTSNLAANEYAKYLLEQRAWDNPDEQKLAEICQTFKLIPNQKAVIGYSLLDDDHTTVDSTKMDEYMDAHGLLLERKAEKEILSDPKATHIGIGFAEDRSKVLVVELPSQSTISVDKLQPGKNGSLLVEGTNLDPDNEVLYAARIVSALNS